MEAKEREIRIFYKASGASPYLDWFRRLKDTRAKQKIQARLARVRLGNLGKTNSVGEGVRELKIDFGPGYRVYFGEDGDTLVILLCGGDKSSQRDDIEKARQYWGEYKKEKKDANT